MTIRTSIIKTDTISIPDILDRNLREFLEKEAEESQTQGLRFAVMFLEGVAPASDEEWIKTATVREFLDARSKRYLCRGIGTKMYLFLIRTFNKYGIEFP